MHLFKGIYYENLLFHYISIPCFIICFIFFFYNNFYEKKKKKKSLHQGISALTAFTLIVSLLEKQCVCMLKNAGPTFVNEQQKKKKKKTNNNNKKKVASKFFKAMKWLMLSCRLNSCLKSSLCKFLK